MRGIERARWVGAALVLVASFGIAGRATVATASPSQASPSSAGPSSGVQTRSSSSAAGISLRVGSIDVNINLPLTIDGLLTVGDADRAATPTRSAPSSSTPPASPRVSDTPATERAPTTSREQSTSPRPAQGGFGVSAANETSRPRSTSAHASRSSNHHGSGGLVLTRRLSDNGSVLLALILAALVIGVAAFVKLSGRRGTHQA